MKSLVRAKFQLEPPADFTDPRSQPDFQAAHWPKCNGRKALRLRGTDLFTRRCLEFLAHYYHLNVLNAELLAARTAQETKARIARRVAAVGAAVRALEQLEDRYAPIGFYGEPVMRGVYYAEIVFVRPGVPRLSPEARAISSAIAIPGLEDIPLSELRGPAIVRRWRHGKTDL